MRAEVAAASHGVTECCGRGGGVFDAKVLRRFSERGFAAELFDLVEVGAAPVEVVQDLDVVDHRGGRVARLRSGRRSWRGAGADGLEPTARGVR